MSRSKKKTQDPKLELRRELEQQRRLNRRSRAFADRVAADKAFFARYGLKP